MAFFNRRVDPRIPDTVEWDTQIIEGATVAEFAELPARYGIRTTQIFNPDAVTCEIADDEYSPFTSLTRIYSGDPTASEYYADGGSAYIFLHADNLGKYARTSIYPGGTVITAERLASDEFKGATGATGPTGATGATGATGPAGPAMDAAINAATDKTSPADADRIGFTDSADGYNLKRFTFANLWAWTVSKVAALTTKTTPVDADGFLITDSAASNVGKFLSWANLKAGVEVKYAKLSDTKSNTTDGGTATSGSFEVRTINTEDSDASGIVSISSNRFSLAAGSYRIYATVPGCRVDGHVAKLYNYTDAADVAGCLGTVEFADYLGYYVNTHSKISGAFTIAGTKEFEIHHRVGATQATLGRGRAASVGASEVYTVVELWKVA